MKQLLSLNNRAIKVFYRSKGNIFFSLLSVLVLVAMHFIIFQQMNTNIWEDVVAIFPGIYPDRMYMQWIVDSMMFSAIIPIGAISIALTSLSLMVSDKESNALSDFLVSPIGRGKLLASYLLSSFIICFAFLIVFVAFFQVYFFIVYGFGFMLIQLGMVFLSMVGAIIFANIFMLLLVSFFNKQQSLSALGSITGILLGFISGAYIPLGMFGANIQSALSALPFAQLTTISRHAFLHTLEDATPLNWEIFSGQDGVAHMFGLELWFGNTYLPLWGAMLMTGGVTLVLLIILVVRFAKMKKAD